MSDVHLFFVRSDGVVVLHSVVLMSSSADLSSFSFSLQNFVRVFSESVYPLSCPL